MSLDADPDSRRPRWVTAAVVLTVVLVVLLVALWVAGGSHGPSRHLSSPASESVPAHGLPMNG